MAVALSGNNTNINVSGSSFNINAETAGNTLILWFGTKRTGGASAISTVATTNVTWARIAGAQAVDMGGEIWFGTVAGGSSGTTVTITLVQSAGSTFVGRLTGFSGVLTVGTIIDVAGVTDNAIGTTPTTPAYTATQQHDLLVALEVHQTSSTATSPPGAPWALVTSDSSGSLTARGAYVLDGTAGPITRVTWTCASAQWLTFIGGLFSSPFIPFTPNQPAEVQRARNEVVAY